MQNKWLHLLLHHACLMEKISPSLEVVRHMEQVQVGMLVDIPFEYAERLA